MFQEADQRTSFDVNFSIFRIPVRVHPFFWVFSAMLGWDYFTNERYGFPYLLLWVAACFVSILIHEMGHILMGRLFGNRGHIVLLGFGGLAIGSTGPTNKRWQRIAVTAAGPGAQLLLFGLLYAITYYVLPETVVGAKERPPFHLVLLGMLLVINLWWPILNLLPIWPLDGGQITREVMEGIRPRDGVIISLVISALFAGILAIQGLLNSQGKWLPYLEWLQFGPFAAIFFLLFCAISLQQLQAEYARRNQRDDDDRFPWE